MIFIANAQGQIVHSVPSAVHRGENKANEIMLLAPYSRTSSVYAVYELPNGAVTKPILLNLAEDLPEEFLKDKNGSFYNAWRTSITAPITEHTGTVTVQFYLVTGGATENTETGTEGVTHATSTATFTVEGIAVPALDNTPSEDSWTQVLAALSVVHGVELDIEELHANKLDKVTSAKEEGTKLYAATPDGQTTVPLSETPSDGAVPAYHDSGKLKVHTDASDETSAASVGHVDAVANTIKEPLSEDIRSLRQEILFHDIIFHQVVVTEIKVEDTFTVRTTAGGLSIVDGAKTDVISVKGNTVAGTNYLKPTASPVTVSNSDCKMETIGNGTYSASVYKSSDTGYRFFWAHGSSDSPLLIGGKTYYLHLRNTDYNSKIYFRAGTSSNKEAAFGFKSLNKQNLIISFKPASDTRLNYIEFRVPGNLPDFELYFDFTPSVELVAEETEYVPYFAGLKNATFMGITSTNKDNNATDTSFRLASEIELGKWDTLDCENQKIDRYASQIEAGAHEYVDVDTTDNGIVWAQFYLADTVDGKGVMATCELTEDYLDDNYLAACTDGTMRICNKTLGKYVRMIVGNLADISTGETATAEEVRAYLSANSVKIAYQKEVAESTEITVPTFYGAYNAGSETVIGNGIPVTVTQTYLTPKGAQ